MQTSSSPAARSGRDVGMQHTGIAGELPLVLDFILTAVGSGRATAPRLHAKTSAATLRIDVLSAPCENEAFELFQNEAYERLSTLIRSSAVTHSHWRVNNRGWHCTLPPKVALCAGIAYPREQTKSECSFENKKLLNDGELK